MEIKLIASTKEQGKLTREQALILGGKAAGICYMQDSLDTIMQEPIEKTQKRIEQTLKSGHHSVYEHVYFSIYLEGVPKILAMVLNNENMYATSEKSGRYTTMKTEGLEKELYEKWIPIFANLISAKYAKLPNSKVQSLAKENARYLISVFTPATNMLYTVSFRQINYILHWCENYINQEDDSNPFVVKVKEVLKEFVNKMEWVYVKDMHIAPRSKELSLFDKEKQHPEVYDSVYSICYKGTFAQLAQAQRHRTIRYKMYVPESPMYYIPYILKKTEYEEEWYEDIQKLGENYPQGRLIYIWERGTYEDFILKCEERLCGQAQLEIMKRTYENLQTYLFYTKNEGSDVYEKLKPYEQGTRCNFPNWQCKSPCIWGKKAIERLI